MHHLVGRRQLQCTPNIPRGKETTAREGYSRRQPRSLRRIIDAMTKFLCSKTTRPSGTSGGTVSFHRTTGRRIAVQIAAVVFDIVHAVEVFFDANWFPFAVSPRDVFYDGVFQRSSPLLFAKKESRQRGAPIIQFCIGNLTWCHAVPCRRVCNTGRRCIEYRWCGCRCGCRFWRFGKRGDNFLRRHALRSRECQERLRQVFVAAIMLRGHDGIDAILRGNVGLFLLVARDSGGVNMV